MSKVEIKIDREGMAQMRCSAEFVELVSGYAETLADRCGDGYGTTTKIVKGARPRAVAIVRAETIKAQRSNQKHNTLITEMYSLRR